MPLFPALTEALRERSCPVCRGARTRILFWKDDCRYVRCSGCDMIYISPVPGPEELERAYDIAGASYFTDPGKLEADFHPDRYRRELAFLGRFARAGRVLDIGCATGSFLEAARRAGFDPVAGVDISRSSVDYAKSRGLNAAAGDFASGLFSEASFDVVTLWATLEHLSDPGRYLSEAFRVLVPGGVVVASVPNWDSLTRRLLGSRYRYIGGGHLNYFASKTFAELFRSRGFSVERQEARGFNPMVLWNDLRLRPVSMESQIDHNVRTHRVKTRRVYRPLRWAIRTWDETLRLLSLGDLLMIGARKPDRAGILATVYRTGG